MTQTALGVLVDALGAASKEELVQGVRGPELRRSFWAHPSGGVRRVQPATIPVDYAHQGQQLGEVIFLERDRQGRLHCVAHVGDDVRAAVEVRVADQTVRVDHDLFWSGQFNARMNGSDAEIISVAITPQTARICATPIRLLPGDLNYCRKPRPEWKNLTEFERGLLERAARYHAERRKHGGGPIVVQGDHTRTNLLALEPRSTRLIETRAATVADVALSQRQVTLLVAPAEVPATIRENGRTFTETYAHGCFATSEADPGKVKLNRDHAIQRTIGKATHIDAWNEAGCVGVFRIARTALGDETMALLEDGILSASAGFRIAETGGDEWHDRSHRRIKRGMLHHVAVTPDPAHEAAVMLDVRDRVLAGY